MKSTMTTTTEPALLSEVHARHARATRRHWRLWLELGAFGAALVVVGLIILGGPKQSPPVDLSRVVSATEEAPAAAVTDPAPAPPSEPEATVEAAPPSRPVLQGEPVVITVSRPAR
jgi:hypothetical protein